MKVFTKKNSEGVKNAKFVGAHVPTNLYEYLTLYSLTNSTSKTELIVNAISEWYQEESEDSPMEGMIAEIVSYVLIPRWNEVKGSKRNKIKLDKFIEQTTAELEKQGLSKTLVSKILNKFRHAANK